MKVVMLSFHAGPKNKPDLSPGHIHDFDEEEAARLISVGGARRLTDAEMAEQPEGKAAAKSAADAAAKNPT